MNDRESNVALVLLTTRPGDFVNRQDKLRLDVDPLVGEQFEVGTTEPVLS
jgi:hypothetical protein